MGKVIFFTLQKVKSASMVLFFGFIGLSLLYSLLSFVTTLLFKEIIDTASGNTTILNFGLVEIIVF